MQFRFNVKYIENVVVYEKIIRKNVLKNLPFIATENIIMELVKNGQDRQEVHRLLENIQWKLLKM